MADNNTWRDREHSIHFLWRCLDEAMWLISTVDGRFANAGLVREMST